MKLKDCIKGTRVEVYDQANGMWYGVIERVSNNGFVYVIDSIRCPHCNRGKKGEYYPEQLRRDLTKES